MPNDRNLNPAVVESFGREWQAFDQSNDSAEEMQRIFDTYFAIFPWDSLPPNAEGFDLGCGTGRWTRFVAPRIGAGKLHCIDPSAALDVARRNLRDVPNVVFHQAAVDQLPLAPASMDFGYSLGVLHHVPDTAAGVAACAEKLKPGAPFLLYLYYNFENRPAWFRGLWRASDAVRQVTSRLPFWAKRAMSEAAAALVYWPAAKLARGLEKAGANVANFPLATYRTRSYYQMRTDALDRFGTSLEKRFSRADITAMLEAAGCERIRFSDEPPFWCAVGYRKKLP
jgi:SAM-dependent methyltransferase